MALDSYLLAVGITNALAVVPSAIRDTRDLLAGKKPDPKAALRRLQDIKECLIAFEQIGGWLNEAKRMHELLQHLETALLKAKEHHAQATQHGPFNWQAYPMHKVREVWEGAEHFLDRTLSFAQEITYIEDSPLKIDDVRNIVEGPEWACRLVMLAASIRDCFDQYDEGPDNTELVRETARNMEKLDRHVRLLMFKADERIRKESTSLANALAKMVSELRNV